MLRRITRVNRNLFRFKEDTNGSLTIEAAIVVPFVVCVCLLVISLSSMIYKHSRMQDLLNEACLELSYDSFLVDEIGLVDVVQRLNESEPVNNITIDEIQSFGEFLENEPVSAIGNKLSSEFSLDTPVKVFESAMKSLEVIDQSMELGVRVKETFVDEAMYLITTNFGREYINNKLGELIREEGLDVEFVIEHLEMYNYNDSGVVVISYAIDLPFNILESSKMKQTNSSYIQLYNGHGNYKEDFHNDIKTSTYGEGSDSVESITDEDGYFKKVFLTEHGAKYHKNPLCFHIKVNAYPVPLGTVLHKSQCSHCDAIDTSDVNVMVFTTMSGRVYHSTPTCYSIFHHLSFLSEKEAILKGYLPCGTCSD